MSAGELLKQVKALPPRERRKVLKAILALEENGPARRPTKTKRVKWPDVEARAKRIFGKRVLPNLVLLERDEEAF
jgi:mRNA-degrading endonuclease RelE of RelBE toxin-antitoxin system